MSIYIFIKKKSEYKTVTFSSGEIRQKSYKIRIIPGEKHMEQLVCETCLGGTSSLKIEIKYYPNDISKKPSLYQTSGSEDVPLSSTFDTILPQN